MSISRLMFELYDAGIRRRPMLRYLREAERLQWSTAEQIRALQLAKLKALLAHAARDVPYFREMLPSRGIDPSRIDSIEALRALPLMTKELVRSGYERFVSPSRGVDNIRKSTGGSTGDPFQFQYDRDGDFRRLAAMWRGYRWAGADIGCRSAFLWSWPYAGRRGWSLRREQLYQRVLGRTYFNIFELSDATLPDVARRIARLRPEIIVCYVSGGVTLARWLIDNRCSIPPPRGVITGAEALHEHDRQLMQQAFGAPVFNTYGGREFMLIAAECERREGLHLTADHLIVETVNERGEPVVGEPGRVLITDLHNYGMPFIRYANGDVATLDPNPCPCGRGLPLLRSIQGREADVVGLPDGRRLTGLFFVHLFKDFEELRYFKVIQATLDTIHVLAVPKPGTAERLARRIRDALQPAMGPTVTVTVDIVAEIPLTHAGKRRIVESRVPRT